MKVLQQQYVCRNSRCVRLGQRAVVITRPTRVYAPAYLTLAAVTMNAFVLLPPTSVRCVECGFSLEMIGECMVDD